MKLYSSCFTKGSLVLHLLAHDARLTSYLLSFVYEKTRQALFCPIGYVVFNTPELLPCRLWAKSSQFLVDLKPFSKRQIFLKAKLQNTSVIRIKSIFVNSNNGCRCVADAGVCGLFLQLCFLRVNLGLRLNHFAGQVIDQRMQAKCKQQVHNYRKQYRWAKVAGFRD